MFQPIRTQEWGSEPITFQAGKGEGPDGFIRLALRRELPQNINLQQLHLMISMLNVKKKQQRKNTLFPIRITFCRVMFSYLLWASEIVFRTNTLHSLLATLPSKAAVELNCGSGILFSGAPPGDMTDRYAVSLLLLTQQKNVMCHSK